MMPRGGRSDGTSDIAAACRPARRQSRTGRPCGSRRGDGCDWRRWCSSSRIPLGVGRSGVGVGRPQSGQLSSGSRCQPATSTGGRRRGHRSSCSSGPSLRGWRAGRVIASPPIGAETGAQTVQEQAPQTPAPLYKGGVRRTGLGAYGSYGWPYGSCPVVGRVCRTGRTGAVRVCGSRAPVRVPYGSCGTPQTGFGVGLVALVQDDEDTGPGERVQPAPGLLLLGCGGRVGLEHGPGGVHR